MPIVPAIYESGKGGSTLSYDIFSKLLKDRIIFVGGNDGAISTDDANMMIAQLLYLESEDNDKPINLYINSPGGQITAGLAIYDTMMNIKCPVHTLVVGMAMSFGLVLAAAGEPGKRAIMPYARMMMHQPLIGGHGGGISGQSTDIEIEAREMHKNKQILAEILSFHTGKSVTQILKDGERNSYFSAAEAKEYGFVDNVVKSNKYGKLQEGGYWDVKSSK
jgi:ATP-dependent Clp protease protease subunit